MASAGGNGEEDARKVVLGVIGGSGLLKSAMFAPETMKEEVVETEAGFGKIKLMRKELNEELDIVFAQRHACDVEKDYSPPHLVNFRGLLSAMKQVGVNAILAVCSVGSMRHHIGMGALVLPDDFFCPQHILTTFDDARGHNVPGFNDALRTEILTALFRSGERPLDGGVYVNSNGPRFETKAEIRFMSQCGEIIGMTGAHEATLAKELGIPYAMLAIVDNMANGIGPQLTLEEFFAVQHKNQPKIENAVHVVLNHFKAYPEVLLSLDGDGADASADDKAPSTPASPKEVCDEVVHAKSVVTVDAEERVLENHAVAIKDGKIVDILPSHDADVKYGAFSSTTTKVVRLPDSVLMPGLINAHTHTPMVFMRGFSDDLPLDKWLTEKIWPTEVRTVSKDFVRDGSRLACAEFIRGGVTCFSDMYFFPESTAEIIEETGIRGFPGSIVIGFPSNYAQGPAEYLEKGRKMIEDYSGRTDRLKFCVAPHSTYAVSEEDLIKAHKMAREFNLPFHTHLHETEREVDDSERGDRSSSFCHQCDKKCRPLRNLLDNGIVDEHFVAAHMVHIKDDEIKEYAAAGAHVVHCPTSNLKLASGFCPVQKIVDAGINVAIGTDGASSNNSLDMFQEMKLAAIMAKGVAKEPCAIPATQALRMATINGAKALGIADQVGSLEVGKQADMIAVDLSDLSCLPTYHVVSHLVYACNRHQVSDVWVQGKCLMRSRQLLTIDAGKLRRVAEKWQAIIAEVDSNHDGTYQ
ncbi:S-methyl-5'-thioadenosine phosphorylase [Hondaea fermentalgiana]|uniref:S-methyl-5'-thioadenosine phosphorylase n=1 Tax=Hondaea fermentalgiana TaxID=2315210 RepID=A0A2R5GE13_9STRA|nr:S-methyl-5'-thioadenosine phosphorylase [Hondaea fermentalgiana]|eukprot:GBG27968.1 S-methyl-5'-thioadenosine phosphorylase [Hondaea fermentalgiana]